MDILQRDKEFKASIGAFIIAFSELEFGLTSLCQLTEFDLRKQEQYQIKYIGFTLENKLKLLDEFIRNELEEIYETWKGIHSAIKEINLQRRYLAHGFVAYHLPNQSISAYVKTGKIIQEQEFTIKTIEELTEKIHHLKTGTNGINGEFYFQFKKLRISKWNQIVNDDFRIKYFINDEIVNV